MTQQPTPPDNYETLKECPECHAKPKMRPFGSDILTVVQGGYYYRICEMCKTSFAFKKGSNEVMYKGAHMGLVELQRDRRITGALI